MPIKLVISGAAGRMGGRLAALAAADPRWSIVAAFERSGSPALGRDVGELAGIGPIGVAIAETPSPNFDVLLDFSSPAGTAVGLRHCLQVGRPILIGTTGHDPDQSAAIAAAARGIPVLRAANTSVGVTVLLDLVEQAAARLGAAYDVEIIEAHHRLKVDAPSGTALALLGAIDRGRGEASDVVSGRSGPVGPRPRGPVGMHAVRGGDVVGEHEVRFIADGETVSLRHVAHSRDTFARGALRAAAWLVGRPPGLYSMRDVLTDRLSNDAAAP